MKIKITDIWNKLKFRKNKNKFIIPIQKTEEFNLLKSYDYGLLLAVIALASFGLLMVTSAVRPLSNSDSLIKTQIIGFVGGIIIAVALSLIDYRDYKILGFIIYAGGIVLLILIFTPLGVEINGSHSWLKIPGITTIQPAEFAKIGFVIVCSVFLERIKQKKGKLIINLLLTAGFAGLPMGLILLQPDSGTLMVMAFIFFMMVFICGLQFRYIFIGVGSLILSLPFVWFLVLKDYQRGRVLSFFYPEVYKESYSYNVIRSQIAFGSGGLTGKGIYNGDLTASGFVPVQESDFIFSVIGEEMGFIGTVILLLFIMFILLWFIWIAKTAEDDFGRFAVTGLGSMMMFHFFENIGSSLGVLPVTGIPLPFISQGASSMVANFMAVGVILSVSARRKRNYFEPKKSDRFEVEE